MKKIEKQNLSNNISIYVIAAIVSFILIFGGLFLLNKDDKKEDSNNEPENTDTENNDPEIIGSSLDLPKWASDLGVYQPEGFKLNESESEVTSFAGANPLFDSIVYVYEANDLEKAKLVAEDYKLKFNLEENLEIMNKYENIELQYDNQKAIDAKYLFIIRVETNGVLTISVLDQTQVGTL